MRRKLPEKLGSLHNFFRKWFCSNCHSNELATMSENTIVVFDKNHVFRIPSKKQQCLDCKCSMELDGQEYGLIRAKNKFFSGNVLKKIIHQILIDKISTRVDN